MLKKIKESKEIQQISLLISELSATVEQIGEAGTRLFAITYGGKQDDSLNNLRYTKFMEMVSPSKAFWTLKSSFYRKSSTLSQSKGLYL